MKSRVAVPAALITLIALILLPIYNSLNIADDRNESILREMKSISRIAGEMTEDAAAAERQEVISSLNLQADIAYGLYQSDSTPLCTSDDGANWPSGVNVESIAIQKVRIHRQSNADGVPTIYAIYRYDDGAFLVLSAEEINVFQVLANRQGIIWIVLLLIMAGHHYLQGKTGQPRHAHAG